MWRYPSRIRHRLPLLGAFGWATLALLACAETDASRAARSVPRDVQAELPTQLGELWNLCPAPDVPQALYDRQRSAARAATRALIRELGRRPNDVVIFTSHDAHTGAIHRERLSVRELAEEHLRSPGVEGVPCERTLMNELQQTLHRAGGTTAVVGGEDAVVFSYDEIIRALRLRKRNGVYRSVDGCEINALLTDREEVALEREEAVRNHVVVTDPAGIVGVSVFKPSESCIRDLAGRLDALARSK